MSTPIVTTELARRLTRAEADYMAALLTSLRAHYGAACGITVQRFGDALALRYPGNPNPLFNRVLGFGPEDAAHVDAVLEWYRQCGVSPRLEIIPYLSSASLLQTLAARGLYQCGFYSVLYGLPSAGLPPPAPGVTVREIGADELDAFAQVYSDVYEQPEAIRQAVKVSVRVAYGQPGWRCYLASVGGVVAAMAALYVQDGVGSLAAGATRPAFRGRGCQTALLRRRIADARREGCDLVASYTEVGSVSQHNMERVGLRIAYNKAEWAPLPG